PSPLHTREHLVRSAAVSSQDLVRLPARPARTLCVVLRSPLRILCVPLPASRALDTLLPFASAHAHADRPADTRTIADRSLVSTAVYPVRRSLQRGRGRSWPARAPGRPSAANAMLASP